jgi:hypothetical protein
MPRLMKLATLAGLLFAVVAAAGAGSEVGTTFHVSFIARSGPNGYKPAVVCTEAAGGKPQDIEGDRRLARVRLAPIGTQDRSGRRGAEELVARANEPGRTASNTRCRRAMATHGFGRRARMVSERQAPRLHGGPRSVRCHGRGTKPTSPLGAAERTQRLQRAGLVARWETALFRILVTRTSPQDSDEHRSHPGWNTACRVR